MDVKKLIEEVLNNLANDKPLSSVVSKVQMISLILKDVKFKEWVDCEFFNGYFKDIDVPSYRKICILGVKAQIIVSKGFGGAVQYSNILLPIDLLGKETYNLIAEIPIKDSISVIQQLLENKGKKTSAVNSAEAQCIKTLVLEGQIIEMHKEISDQSLYNIINQTKAKLINFFFEINEKVLDNGIDFNVMNKKEEIAKVVTNNIYAGVVHNGNGSIDASSSNNVGGQNNTVTISADIKQQLNRVVDDIEKLSQEVDEDRTDIAQAIIDIKTNLNSESAQPQLLKNCFNMIKGVVGAGKIFDFAQQAIELVSEIK